MTTRNQSLDVLRGIAIILGIVFFGSLFGFFAYSDSGSIADTVLRLGVIAVVVLILWKKL